MHGSRLTEARRAAAAASLRQLRTRLLDLTGRNPLISFPHTRQSGGRAGLRAVAGPMNALFAQVAEGKTLPIRPLPEPGGGPADENSDPFLAALEAARWTDAAHQSAVESLAADELVSARAAGIERALRDRVRATLGLPAWNGTNPTGLADHARRLGIDPSFELAPTPGGLTAGGLTADRAPARREFQTLLLPDPLERSLAKIRDTARTVAEETGVSTLHLAFGFLEWFESDSADKPLTSPLLLLRVDLERRIVRSRYQYVLLGTDDEAQVNLTLAERLSRDFRIRLPAFAEDETPEAYLARVQAEVCQGRKRWRVRRCVTLAHFPFARLAMFHDLDESAWTEAGGLAGHAVLGELLGGSESHGALFAEEHDVDAPDVAAKVPLLVLDADASQHSAIYDVMRGRNLVIEGPPGTGKSQTITNIIAAALANRKRVLFVADKQAALQVVKDRLDKVGLGAFCLELHSGKARKKAFLDSLTQRLTRRPTPVGTDALAAMLGDLAATRAALSHFVATLNAPVGGFGATVHDVLWADRRRRDGEGEEARQLDAVALPACESLTQSDIDRRREVLDRFELAARPILAGFGGPALHPWYGVTRSDLPAVDFEPVLRDIADTATAMQAADQAVAALAALGIGMAASIPDALAEAAAMAALPVPDGIPAGWYLVLGTGAARQAAGDWLRAGAAYRHAIVALHRYGGTVVPEAAAAIEACLLPLRDSVSQRLPLSGLASWSSGLRQQAARIRALAAMTAEAAGLLGLPAPTRLDDIIATLQAVELAVAAGDRVIAGITPGLADRNSRDTVLAAAADITRLKADATALAAGFSIPASATPDQLRRHAGALRAAGAFGFLSPATRAAQRCYAGLRTAPGKADRQEMAAALTAIAEHLEAVAALDGNQAIRAVFGPRWRGLATDTQAALAVADWAARVRTELAGTGETALGARRALLSGDQDRLEALAAFAAAPAFAALRAHVGRPAAAFDALAAALETRAAAADALAAAGDRHGLAGSTTMAALAELCRLIRAAAAAEIAARLPAALADVFGAPLPAPGDDPGALANALALAAAVAALPLNADARRVLQAMPPDDIRTRVLPAAQTLGRALDHARSEWQALRHRLGIDDAAFLGSTINQAAPAAIADRLRLAAHHADQLGTWVAYLIERRAAEALGLGGLLSLWDETAIRGPLPAAFDRVLYRALARFAFARHPELDRFTGLGQDAARARFKALDRQVAELRRLSLANQLADCLVPKGNGVGRKSDYTESALILAEMSKQKRHIPIRQLLDRAGAAILALKPCFMMSPLSVAQYLRPGGLRFDLLVIDEASQMRPEDAVGAIARSSQIVVVGDPKQLPPTSFFARLDGADDEDEEQVEADSILDLAQAVFRPMRRLRWHYRSRHGSLVAFSNREFYDGDLIVFPSPAEADATQGVTVTKVDGICKARSNLAEVAAVCDAAVAHMRQHPGRSLGIATMNQVQRDLIAQEMDRRATLHPEVEDYRERWSATLERFFVKNLENVQGDERDVILVSTVFGPSEPGGRVRQMFGPINGRTGHRRLNVLFTRAKQRVHLFTSMAPDDVLAGPDSPRGAQVLKAYLAYAATGQLDAGTVTGPDATSDFEVFVRDRLRSAGYAVVPRVGVAGFRIDLAVRDPDVPGRFLLGIECDGAAYHATRSARDRNILRQEMLEGLGWTIHRVWSTDWFRDPAGQTRALITSIEGLRQRQLRW